MKNLLTAKRLEAFPKDGIEVGNALHLATRLMISTFILSNRFARQK